MPNSHGFRTLAELDRTYRDHVDSLLAGGFITKGSPEYESLLRVRYQAVRDYLEAKNGKVTRLPKETDFT